jgi:hypothetical protein
MSNAVTDTHALIWFSIAFQYFVDILNAIGTRLFIRFHP